MRRIRKKALQKGGRWVTRREAAVVLGVTERTVDRRRRDLHSSGTLWTRRDGRRVWIWIPKAVEMSLETRLCRAEARIESLEVQLSRAQAMYLELHRTAYGDDQDAAAARAFGERVRGER